MKVKGAKPVNPVATFDKSDRMVKKIGKGFNEMFCYPVIIEQTKDWVDYIQAIASLVVAGCAFFALRTWRKEFVGKKKIEFAAEFVEKAIDMKEFIAYVRNGFSSSSEENEIKEQLKKENESFTDNCLFFLTPKFRILKNDDRIKYFYSLRVKALMYFGEDSLNLYKTLSLVLSQIKNRSEILYDEHENLSSEKKREYESVIWGTFDSDDKIAQEIEKAVEELKLNLEPLYQDKTFKWKTLK